MKTSNTFRQQESHPRASECILSEDMLVDALDGTLTEADQLQLDQHIATCAACATMLADAQRGAAWLDMLKLSRPEPSAELFARIMAQTSGVQSFGDQMAGDQTVGNQTVGNQTVGNQTVGAASLEFVSPKVASPTAASLLRAAGSGPESIPHLVQPAAGAWLIPTPRTVSPVEIPTNLLSFPASSGRRGSFAQRFINPRLAMTAAMAFFSIALTMNLTGVRLNEVHASDLNPTSLRRTFYQAKSGAVRQYDSLHVVQVLESRVDDLRDLNATGNQQPEPASQPTAPRNIQPDAPAHLQRQSGQISRGPEIRLISRNTSSTADDHVLVTHDAGDFLLSSGGI